LVVLLDGGDLGEKLLPDVPGEAVGVDQVWLGKEAVHGYRPRIA